MSNNVDKRVVQMEFDNAAFERKVAKTRQTIKGLKNDLNFEGTADSLNSLSKATKNFDLSTMASNIEKISNRFSTMGIVGATIIQDLTNSVIGFGKKIASSTIGQIISGGTNRALNLEQAKFQISGLNVDWEDTATELGVSLRDQINNAVSGTAYGLDASAKVAGQLLASNIKAGTQEMQDALSGISGVAAMTNSTYEEIGHIFTTIAGNGRVMAEQLNQFAGRGLNVAAELAKVYGVDEAALRKMVSEGKVDFKTFATAMNAAFGKQATKANDTYTGSLSNVRAALSRIGEGFITPKNESFRRFFVELIPVLNAVKKTLGPVYEIAEKGMYHLSSTATDLLHRLAFKDEDGLHLTGLQTVYYWISKISELLNQTGKDGWTSIGYIYRAIQSIIDIIFTLVRLIKTVLTPVFKGFSNSAIKGMNPILLITGAISKALLKLGGFIKEVVDLIDETINQNDALSRTISGVTTLLKGPVGLLGVLIKILGGLIKVSVRITGVVLQILAPIGDLIVKLHETFIESGLLGRIFRPLVSAFKALGSTLLILAKAFKIFFNGALKPLRTETKSATSIWETFVQSVTNALVAFVSFVSKYLGKFNEFLLNHQTTIQKVAKYIGDAFVALVGGIKKGWDKIKDFVSSWSGPSDFFKTISDRFVSFRNNISDTIASFKDIKTSGITSFTENFKQSTGPLQAIVKFLLTAWETIKSIAIKVGPVIKVAVTAIFDGLSGLLGIVKSGFDSLSIPTNMSLLTSGGIVAGLSVMLVQVKKILTSVENIQKNSPFERLLKFVDSLTDYMGQLKKNKAAEALKDFAKALLEIAAAVLILSMIEPDKMFGALMAVSVLIWELVQAFKAIDGGSLVASAAASKTASALVKMASALLVLAFAIKVFENMDPGKMILSSVIVSALLWELVAVMKALSGASGEERKVIKGAGSLIVMALAVKILSKSIAKLAEMNPKNVAVSAAAVVAMGASLAKMAELASKNNDGLLKSSLAILVMAFALGKIAKVVAQLTKLNQVNLMLSTAAIIAITLALKALIELKKNDLDKIAKTIKGIATGLILLAVAFKIFENVDSEAMKKAGLALGAVMASMLVMMAALAALEKFSKNGTGYLKVLGEVGIALAGLGVAVAGLAAAAKLLVDVKWEDIGKAGVVLAGALVALTAIVLLSKIKMNYNNMKAMAMALIAMSGALVVFGAALGAFTLIPILGLIKGIGVLAAALGLLIGTTYALQKANVDVLIGLAKAMALVGVSMFLFSAGLLAFAAALPPLAAGIGLMEVIFTGLLAMIVKLGELIANAVGEIIKALLRGIIMAIPALKQTIIDSVTEVLNVLNDIIPKIGDTLDVLLETIFPLLKEWIPKLLKFIGQLVPDITEMLVVILIRTIEMLAERVPELVFAIAKFFGNLLSAIKDVAGVEFNSETLTNILLGLGIFAVILVVIAAAANIAQKAIGGMIALIAFCGLITFMFIALMSLDTEQFVNVALGLSAAFLAISAAMFIISMVPIAGALMGALGLIVIVATLTAVLYALGELAKNIDGLKETLESGIEIFGLIGTAIGTFVGNLAGSLLGGLSSSLPTIADNLSSFMTNLQPFIDGLNSLNQAILDGALILCEVILAFTAASLLEGIANFFGGGVNFAQFGQQLVDFAPYIGQFADAVSGVKTEEVAKAAHAAKALADFAAAIPNSGGFAGLFAGENDMGEWAKQLKGLADGLVAFNNVIQNDGAGLDTDAIKNAADAGTAIALMAKEIPNSGGLLGDIVGNNDMGTWADQLAGFAQGLVDFNNIILNDGNGIDKEAVEDAAEAAGAIASMAKEIPNEGGWLAKVVGDNSLATWAPELATLGDNLVAFSNSVSGENLDTDAMDAAIAATASIVDIAKEIPNEGKSFVSFFVGDNSLSTFAEHLPDLGDNIAKFSESLTDVNLIRVNTAIKGLGAIALMAIALSGVNADTIKDFAESISSLGQADVEAFLSAFENAEADCQRAATSFVAALTYAIELQRNSVIQQAGKTVRSFSDGVIQNGSSVYTAFTNMMGDALSALSEFDDDLYTIGSNFAIGLSNGIAEHSRAVSDAASAVANAAIVATKVTLDENSPSKEAFKSGKFWDLGLAGGMNAFAYTVSDASESVSNEVIDYVGYLQSAIDGIDFDDIDPTIRPVMDMSNINTGVRAIDELMNSSRTYSIGTAISRDRAEYSKRANTLKVETDNKDIINALNELKDEMSDMKDKMSRMGVYLDGKTMVGELTDPLDRSLGAKAAKNGGSNRVYGRLVQR